MSTFTVDMAPAEDAARRIAWAARGMPVLRVVSQRLAEEQELNGLRIGVGLVLDPKTANFALALKRAGAVVSVYCSARSTTQSIVRALESAGIAVFADQGSSEKRDLELAREFVSAGLDILIDDGAEIIWLAHREFPELVKKMVGATEESTSGVRLLRAMNKDGSLLIPVIAVNEAKPKYLFDDLYGTGQSCVMAMLDITNLQLAGRGVLVVGYGWVGRGVARHAAALGARITVAEIDPIKALLAHHDGHRVRNVQDAASSAEVIFAATGIAGVVSAEHVTALPDGAILCTAGAGALELPMTYLDGLGTGRVVREAITEYTLASGRRVLVIAGGERVNGSEAEGNPIEVMDLSLSLQALAVAQLVREGRDLIPGLHPLSRLAEDEVATIRLRHEGATLEPLTAELSAAMHSW